MCELMCSDAVPADDVLVSVHPHMVRVDLVVGAGDGELSLAFVELSPEQAEQLERQLRETRIVAVQIISEGENDG